MTCNCNICLEPFVEEINPAYTCNPCGHGACKPCLDEWRRSNNSCHICRQNISNITINRTLMDHNSSTNNVNNVNNEQFSDQGEMFHISKSLKKKELLKDKCQASLVVIDNSGSMEYYEDGKIIVKDHTGKLNILINQLRFKEAMSKAMSIAEYNIKRNINASYYLLNPKKTNVWIENVDYIKINPNNLTELEKVNAISSLKDTLLQLSNIRGSTPLDVITRYLKDHLHNVNDNDSIGDYHNIPISYVIITDGNPNNRLSFETQIRHLCKDYNIFLVINLCTDDEDTITYYNRLDKVIGTELSGMDVIDDMVDEAKEIYSTGNNYFVYSLDIHISRMAGCYSPVADYMDEKKLNIHYINKLLREITNTDFDFSTVNFKSSPIKYLENIDTINFNNDRVYDINSKNFSFKIHKYRLLQTLIENIITEKLNNIRFVDIIYIFLLIMIYYSYY